MINDINKIYFLKILKITINKKITIFKD
jgi:hypothetical protein